MAGPFLKRKGGVAAALLVLLMVFPLAVPSLAAAAPITVTIIFDRTSYALGSEVTASYSISGGSGNYKYISYSCYSWENNSLVNIESGTLTSPCGALCYTPVIGQKTDVRISGFDSDGRFFSADSPDIPLTGSSLDNPVIVSFTFDKEYYRVGSQVRATYRISGGCGSYRNVSYTCYGYEGNTLVRIDGGDLSSSSGTILYSPVIGDTTYISMYGNDSEGRFFSTDSQRIPLAGGGPAKPITIEFTFDKECYQLGSEIQVEYRINGGCGSFRSISYDCYSSEDFTHVHICGGDLISPVGTISYTPRIGQITDVQVRGHDREGRFFSVDSESIGLYDCSNGYHHLIHSGRIEPTCTTEGRVEYWECDFCHKKFGDADAQGEITSTTISKTAHKYVKVDRVEPTCTEMGIQLHWTCSVCGKLFQNNKFRTELSSVPRISATGHSPTTDPAVAPTATRTGKTEGTHCYKCGTVLKAQKTIPSLSSDSALILPASTVTIEAEAFSGLNCEVVVIPYGCTSIGAGAFRNCHRLIYVKIPPTVQYLAADAFYGSGGSIFIDR